MVNAMARVKLLRPMPCIRKPMLRLQGAVRRLNGPILQKPMPKQHEQGGVHAIWADPSQLQMAWLQYAGKILQCSMPRLCGPIPPWQRLPWHIVRLHGSILTCLRLQWQI